MDSSFQTISGVAIGRGSCESQAAGALGCRFTRGTAGRRVSKGTLRAAGLGSGAGESPREVHRNGGPAESRPLTPHQPPYLESIHRSSLLLAINGQELRDAKETNSVCQTKVTFQGRLGEEARGLRASAPGGVREPGQMKGPGSVAATLKAALRPQLSLQSITLMAILTPLHVRANMGVLLRIALDFA
ncbi:hypothetical protein SKAU_G00316970 [Synaphobranchus kaupii]|uniref:Uncharacterized protein n=1 Tax=Synaphobranchus kaupii TaxID=118154 RepID=A0A9Q1ILM2_SYNKA|nr:hypothetical protein SKAU_G00316970 [Synaphobranchus kaupii]